MFIVQQQPWIKRDPNANSLICIVSSFPLSLKFLCDRVIAPGAMGLCGAVLQKRGQRAPTRADCRPRNTLWLRPEQKQQPEHISWDTEKNWRCFCCWELNFCSDWTVLILILDQIWRPDSKQRGGREPGVWTSPASSPSLHLLISVCSPDCSASCCYPPQCVRPVSHYVLQNQTDETISIKYDWRISTDCLVLVLLKEENDERHVTNEVTPPDSTIIWVRLTVLENKHDDHMETTFQH